MSDHDDPRSDGPGGRQPSDGDRRRYFAESMGSGQSGNRHRRRRAPGDPTTTGSIPIVRVGDSLPDPTIEYRTPEPPAGEPSPYFQVQYRPTEVEGLSFTEPRTSPRSYDPPTIVNPPARHLQEPPPPPPQSEPTGLFDILDATHDEPVAQAPTWTEHAGETTGAHARYEAPAPAYETPAYEPAGRADPVYVPAAGAAPEIDVEDHPAVDYSPIDDDIADRPMPARKRNRKVIVSIVAILLVLILVLAGFALKALGVFDSSTDYSSTTGHGSALVEVQSDATVRDIGDTLTDAGVVGSRKAFVNATGNDTVAAGFYNLPKGISAQAAVEKMQGSSNRVGFMVVPEGLQLDTKEGVDGKTTPGIFQRISDATTVKTDDRTYGVSVEDLVKAASTASASELGIPSWALEAFNRLGQDHRRIEGLIASGAWEDLDPRMNAVELLRTLITNSDKRFTAWGLESDNNTGLTPYQTLVTASIVEREARKDEDFPKVSRVILNRLKADQRLEMDSTANYTARVTNIDVFGDAYKDENAWNTYQHDGLPITPIGAVGERALHATMNPAQGDWLYFVTVDKDGTTLFAKTFDQHKKNRQVACDNKLLTTGCA
ncbi:endolytic transglycosylase MltG [Gordonia neofelifaecis]|uniref:Endolytic murein transglycosylase n=1 Tax=Gordonia neofelifaecis NRRL B-59395 TaxID=644548 RepID=F1YG84_9ACTN|nr:endolytic transglycosylase MltG [Gordonia neofelifaecis]EGD56057.1 aminodeoxychorismate lyase [Gordonia neofelifaecis NRRL B-59395]